ncbi:uncharacterized protein ACNLHF_020844 isoform 2-T2 [Anomaloglossus baeobatrachus]
MRSHNFLETEATSHDDQHCYESTEWRTTSSCTGSSTISTISCCGSTISACSTISCCGSTISACSHHLLLRIHHLRLLHLLGHPLLLQPHHLLQPHLFLQPHRHLIPCLLILHILPMPSPPHQLPQDLVGPSAPQRMKKSPQYRTWWTHTGVCPKPSGVMGRC